MRIQYEGAFYHITSRGNQRERIFWDDKDREEFKRILKRTKERYGYHLHAYVLMDNHYHLLIETPHANIKQVMQNINTSYTVSVNKRHKRVGHLFQGRYKAFIADKESYLLEINRYIHLNPVRASIVQRPENYKWSSYRAYIGAGDGITDTEDTLYAFAKKRTKAIEKYKEFVKAGIGGTSPLKKAVGSILGDETFRDKVIRYIKGRPDRTEIPEIKKIEMKQEIEEIIKVVANHYGLKEDELLKRKKATEGQRKKAIYLCRVLSGRTNSEIGRAFGITLQAVTNAARGVEKKMAEDMKLNREMASIRKAIDE